MRGIRRALFAAFAVGLVAVERCAARIDFAAAGTAGSANAGSDRGCVPADAAQRANVRGTSGSLRVERSIARRVRPRVSRLSRPLGRSGDSGRFVAGTPLATAGTFADEPRAGGL